MVHALVLSGFGINCEEEMAAAWRLAGASAQIVHLSLRRFISCCVKGMAFHGERRYWAL